MKSRVLISSLIASLPLTAMAELPDVAPMDWSGLSPDSFTDQEVDRQANYGPAHTFTYYVHNFYRLANAVRDEPPNYGFIDIAVWRSPDQQEPYNARLMENILSLSWFYTHDADWNPYYGDPATRQRLEAALTHWISIANPDGRFAETSPTNYKLAPTAFAARFVGEALHNLAGGPPIDTTIHNAATEVHRKAVMWTLNSNADFNTGSTKFSNQYGNIWGGALSYLDLRSDTDMANKLLQRVNQSPAMYSPAGYPYEERGPDFSYNLNTHMSNIDTAWNYVHDRENALEQTIADTFAAEHAKFMEWLSYNAVRQPNGNFILNTAVSTRQQQGVLQRLDSPLAEVVPLARAFSLTVDEIAARIAHERQLIAAEWGNFPDLEVGSFTGYSPYAFMHRDHYKWYPTEQQRQEAIAQLPYIARDRFNHQRVDSLEPQVYTYVRRPTYYAAFNSGNELRSQQRKGLGLLWHPQAGAVMQSQLASTSHAWGTRTVGGSLFEANAITASYSVDGNAVTTSPGTRDLADGVLKATYNLGTKGSKQILFNDDHIAVSVLHSGNFIEQFPLLLLPDDDLQIDGTSSVSLMRDGQAILNITFGDNSNISQILTDPSGMAVDNLQVVSVHVHATDQLEYQIQLVPEPTAVGAVGGAAAILFSRPRRAAGTLSP